MFDVVTWGEVRSETGQKSLFRQREDGFVFVESCGMRHRDFSDSHAKSLAPLLSRRPPNGKTAA